MRLFTQANCSVISPIYYQNSPWKYSLAYLFSLYDRIDILVFGHLKKSVYDRKDKARFTHTQFHTNNGFSNLWKHCYRFTHPFCHTVENHVPFRYHLSFCLARCITCQDVCDQQSHAAKCFLRLLESKPLKIVALVLLRNKDQR